MAMPYSPVIALQREAEERFIKVERNFLGSNWSFYVTSAGKAYWLHKSGKVLESSRNWEKK